MTSIFKDFSDLQQSDLVGSRADISTRGDGTALLLGADREACEVSSEILERCGLDTLRLSRVAELRETRWDRKHRLVLCEDTVADGNFRDVLGCISKKEPPVIVFSRLADWDQYLLAVRLGAYDLLRFPFRTGELRWVIGRALADSRAAMPLRSESGARR